MILSRPSRLYPLVGKRNTATGLILLGFSFAAPQHDPPHRPQRIRWRNRAENAQRDRDLWPRGNTAPETTLLSGYGVDTLRWAITSRHREPQRWLPR